MRLELAADSIAKLRKVLHYNGLPIDARSITDEILTKESVMPDSSIDRSPAAAGSAASSTAGCRDRRNTGD